MNAKIVGGVLRSCRIARGMTQEVLSGFADLERAHYSKLERGLQLPSLETLFKIAGALDMPPHELVLQMEEALTAPDEKPVEIREK